MGPCGRRQQTTVLYYQLHLVCQLLPCYLWSLLGAVTVSASGQLSRLSA